MEYLAGFMIAVAVGLTGVGAGSVTAPVLILFFGLSPADSVGTALVYASIIKLAVLPVYFYRRQIHYRTLGLLCAGGLPGVVLGFYLLRAVDVKRQQNTLFLVLGLTVCLMAAFNLYRATRRHRDSVGRDRTSWLPALAALIGVEVGFSSAGAGALGSAVLLALTSLTPAQVVGTDMMFGLATSLVGGGFHLFAGHLNEALLMKFVTGGIVGAFLGATLSSLLPARPLRVGMSLWIASLGAQLCWRALA